MDPRQFVKNSNVSIQTESKVVPTKKGGLKIGKFHRNISSQSKHRKNFRHFSATRRCMRRL